jgi:hypothetical protein
LFYGGCSYGNSCLGGGGLQYGSQISSLIIVPSLFSSNVGDNGGDSSCLCSASSHCANKFSNTDGIPAAIITNTIKDVNTIKFKIEIICL